MNGAGDSDTTNYHRPRWLWPGVALTILAVVGTIAAVFGFKERRRDAVIGSYTDEVLGITFIRLAGGKFGGADTSGDMDARAFVSAFDLAKSEVTQKQWREIMGENPSDCFEGNTCADDLPVQRVSWEDAMAFLNRASERSNMQPCYHKGEDGAWLWRLECDGFRLPTEAEWEYACRAGSTGEYGAGVNAEELSRYAHHGQWMNGGTAPVKSLEPNAWGLHDMHGNVWEWVWDGDITWSNPSRLPSGNTRAMKGGGFSDSASILGCGLEGSGLDAIGFRSSSIGLRVARGAKESGPTDGETRAAETRVPETRVPETRVPKTRVPESDAAPVAAHGMNTSSTNPDDEALVSSSASEYAERVLGMTFVSIEAGEFEMGSPESEENRWKDEVTHRVRVSSFEMMDSEVTQGQWQEVMGTNPSHCFKHGCAPELPVQYMSWVDVVKFTNRLSERSGLQPCYHQEQDGSWQWKRDCDGYRLPTEAEWEYACRAGSTGMYGAGVDAQKLYRYAWYDTGGMGGPSPVKRRGPNAWGLHDMHGNVEEWVWDWYGEYETSTEPARDPGGPANGTSRTLRGGSAISGTNTVRCAIRNKLDPRAVGGSFCGFRVARGARRPHE